MEQVSGGRLTFAGGAEERFIMAATQQADVDHLVAQSAHSTKAAYFAHETAIIEPNCRVGARTKIWHHSHLRADASVGEDCVIGKNVFVDAYVSMGDGCKIQNNVSVYHGVSLGNDVFVGPSVTFTNDRVPRAFNNSWEITPTYVGHGASIGANATIVCGITLGEFSMVAAGATVTHDVAPHQLVAGTPARPMGWVCVCGAVLSREVDQPQVLWCGECEHQGRL